MDRTAEKKRFRRVMLICALVLLCLIAAGLYILNGFLAAYEQAGPETALEAYLSSLDDEKAFSLAEESLRSFDPNLAAPEEIFSQRVKPLLDEGVRAERDAARCTSTREVCRLFFGRQEVGQITLEPGEKGAFGIPVWRVTGEEPDFSFLGGGEARSLTVPEGFSVLCNGYTLDESYVSSRRESRTALDYLRGEGYALPDLVEYTVTDCPLTAVFRVFDEEGAEYAPDTDFDALITRRLLESCSPEEGTRLEDFARTFAEAYVAFMGGTSSSYGAGYRKILPLLEPGSELAERLSSARKGMTWTHNRKNELLGVEINAAIRLGDGKYVCDFSFSVNTQTLSGYTVIENNARLFVVERDGALYACTMLSY